MKSELVDEALAIIKKSIQQRTFIDVEKSKVELKDLSGAGKWKSLHETVCAFLNTDGGIIICGIREVVEKNNKHYVFNGFDRNTESKLIELHTTFKDDNNVVVDLSNTVYFDYVPFLEGEIAVVAVYPLSDDKKFVRYNGEYFERKLTQDRVIPPAKIQRQKEYKADLEHARELAILEDAKINDLSLGKINKYIDLLNREIRNETLKPNLNKAKEFLSKQHFLRDSRITTLGMLVCGDDPFYFLASRAEVNCYYDTSSDIGKDKKIFRNDVISLMEDTFRYIWGHIKINRTIREGGKSEPEYPEKLIRETINNALAHRDYTIDNFVTVRVEPYHFIEIKNPGSFKEKIKLIHTETDIPIRRLIPGIPESKNPKLASVLKVFDKIESQGRGMASLINASLENLIDLPYYEIRDGIISLKIPTGELLDEAMATWLHGFEYYITTKLKKQLTEEHRMVLAYFYKSEMLNRQRYFTILLSDSNNHFAVIEQLKIAELIFEHPASSDEIPVYVLDRVLVKTDFTDELITLIGEEYISYDPTAKEILNITYLYSKFNNKALKATEITPEVYRRLHGKEIIAKKYESLGRKVRGYCNRIDREGILLKDTKSAYTFNFNYQTKHHLF
ncbi:MAG: putative DNA binding domain-containing protein [Bacteroidetes bacterium]|nr:putative DNA binding domain-containing protein [Bacteroidota bacterium]